MPRQHAGLPIAAGPEPRGGVLCLVIWCLALLAGCTALAQPQGQVLGPAPTPTNGQVPGGPRYLPELRVAEPDAGRPRYNRDDWGGWIDADGDGCNTRAEVLRLESAVPTVSKATNCTVVSGDWTDPYTGRHTTSAADLQIDHLVALGDAARSGGWAWSSDRKHAFANDLDDQLQLNAVWGSENERKADYGPDQWLPPDPAFVCDYVAAYVGIKARWDLTVTATTYAAIGRLWSSC